MSGNGNHGTVNGATLGTDRHGFSGKAYSFDGVDDWIEVPSSSQLSIQENLSVSLWVELNSLSDGNFLQKGNSNNGWEWELRYSNIQGARSTIMQLDGSFAHNKVYSNKSLSLNRFTNLISVFSANKFLKLYIDGRLAASSSSFTASFGAGNSPLYIGARKGWVGHPDPSRPFKGSIDDIRIYNRALSVDEISLLYCAESQNHFVDSAKDMEMIWVEPGTFTMGQTGVTNAEPEHNVTLLKVFTWVNMRLCRHSTRRSWKVVILMLRRVTGQTIQTARWKGFHGLIYKHSFPD